jgi:hypothetical protein
MEAVDCFETLVRTYINYTLSIWNLENIQGVWVWSRVTGLGCVPVMGKVNLSLCLIKHYAIMTYERLEV